MSRRWLTIKVKLIKIHLWHFYMSPGEDISSGGSYFPTSFTDEAFLSRTGYHPTFVPHNSALDIDSTGNSGFDLLLSADDAGFHNEFPTELTRPILAELDIKTYWELQASIDKDKYTSQPLFDGDKVTFDVRIEDGSAPYEVTWEHRPACPDGVIAASEMLPEGWACGIWNTAREVTLSSTSNKDKFTSIPLHATWSPHRFRVNVRNASSDAPADSATVATDDTVVEDDNPYGDTISEGRLEENTELGLDGNYPNPFNPSTAIYFTLEESGRVMVRVFDMTGRLVATLADGLFGAGAHNVLFDGSGLASGMYYYTLQLEGSAQVQTRSMLLIK